MPEKRTNLREGWSFIIDHWLLPVGLLLLLFALLVLGARGNSLTVDEPAHITVGYSVLARGKGAFWLVSSLGNPALLDEMEALLFYLANPNVPLEQLEGWPSSVASLIWALSPYLRPVERTEVITRMPIMLLTVLLGAIVFRWGRDLWGQRAGLLALAVLVFDPTLLAHGRLATTDAGTLALGTAALYVVWRWMERPAWRWALATGTLLGLTMLAKSSGVLWTATAGLVAAGTIVRRRNEGRTMMLLAQGAVAGGLSLLLLWANYGFSWGAVRYFPLPLPAPDHWNALFSQVFGRLGAGERWVFALGERTQGSWWWYFPLAFLIKNPLPMLIGWGISLIVLLRQSTKRSWPRLLALGVFPIVYTVSAIFQGMNIGYRYMLSIHPFLYLTIGGGLWKWVRQGKHWRRWLSGACGVWYVAAAIRIFPYEIAYFNELVGGPENGHRYLVDSNLDWGQGSKALRDYLASHPGPKPKVARYFNGAQLDLYGIEFEALPPKPDAQPLTAPFHPPPGRYAIGIDVLQRGWLADPDAYAWFRQVEPTARLAYSFFVYDVDPPPLAWFAQCTKPVTPLAEEEIVHGFGRSDLRRVDFDCTAAWLYPTGGAQPGVYGLHHALVSDFSSQVHTFPSLLPPPPQAPDSFIARRLAEARLSLDIRRPTPQSPAFVLYEQEHAPSTGWPTNRPTPLDGPLTFLSAVAYLDGDGLDVETWWKVTEGPITRPLSIMAHLLAGDGTVLGVADGLGVSPLTLVPGDVVVQRHRFSRPPEGTHIRLRTGAYWLDTGERWSVAGVPGDDALLVPLEVE